MVELRKRPQRDPPAAAPASKRSKAKATAAPASSEIQGESSTAATAPTGIVGRAKKAASKVVEAVAGPLAASEGGAVESSAKQPSVGDEPAPVVETSEAGMVPETAGAVSGGTVVSGGEADSGTATAAAEGKKGRGKGKNVGVGGNSTVSGPATEASTATADSGTATLLPNTSSADARAIRSKAKTMGLTGSSTAAAPPPTDTTTDTAPTDTTITEETRPPASNDLENPPEKGNLDTTTTTTQTPTPASTPLSPTSIGHTLPSLPTFGGQITTHTDTPTNLSTLLSASKSGIIIFTYPRASTPGCTQQACSFRDNHDSFASSGYAIYGLSTDSPKANTTFATKQGLQYPLLCDATASLTGALGMKKAGNAKGTLRGVVVIGKSGVVKVWFQGGPAKTVDVVREFLGEGK